MINDRHKIKVISNQKKIFKCKYFYCNLITLFLIQDLLATLFDFKFNASLDSSNLSLGSPLTNSRPLSFPVPYSWLDPIKKSRFRM